MGSPWWSGLLQRPPGMHHESWQKHRHPSGLPKPHTLYRACFGYSLVSTLSYHLSILVGPRGRLRLTRTSFSVVKPPCTAQERALQVLLFSSCRAHMVFSTTFLYAVLTAQLEGARFRMRPVQIAPLATGMFKR